MTVPLTDGELADRIVAAVHHGFALAVAETEFPDRVEAATVHAILAVVLPELDKLRRLTRYRAAWMNARYRAAGHQQRYHYERKLCHSTDIRATKAIRAQLAVEQERDRAVAENARLRAELTATREPIALEDRRKA